MFLKSGRLREVVAKGSSTVFVSFFIIAAFSSGGEVCAGARYPGCTTVGARRNGQTTIQSTAGSQGKLTGVTMAANSSSSLGEVIVKLLGFSSYSQLEVISPNSALSPLFKTK